MTFDKPKHAGKCIACGEPVRVIASTYPADHALAGYPSRLGAWLDAMTEIEFLLSDGSTTHVTFCSTCAPQIRPEHFAPIWRCVLDCEDTLALATGRTGNQRKAHLSKMMSLYIVALLYRRRKGEGVERVLDRRGVAA